MMDEVGESRRLRYSPGISYPDDMDTGHLKTRLFATGLRSKDLRGDKG